MKMGANGPAFQRARSRGIREGVTTRDLFEEDLQVQTCYTERCTTKIGSVRLKLPLRLLTEMQVTGQTDVSET